MAYHDRANRQPFHARKGKANSQPTPLNRIKAGNKNVQPQGSMRQDTTAKNPADSQANMKPVLKIGTPFHI